MDTSKYDKKMEELRNEEIKKASAGRPKGPEKVVYKRRVPPELVDLLDGVLKTSLPGVPLAVVPVSEPTVIIHGAEDIRGLKDQLQALLNDNERLTNELVAKEEKLQRVARLTDNEKLILWIRKYDALVAKVKAKYPDEGF